MIKIKQHWERETKDLYMEYFTYWNGSEKVWCISKATSKRTKQSTYLLSDSKRFYENQATNKKIFDELKEMIQ